MKISSGGGRKENYSKTLRYFLHVKITRSEPMYASMYNTLARVVLCGFWTNRGGDQRGNKVLRSGLMWIDCCSGESTSATVERAQTHEKKKKKSKQNRNDQKQKGRKHITSQTS